MAEDQLAHNTDSSFFFNRFTDFPELSRLSSSASSSFSAGTCWDELKSDIEEDNLVNNNVDVVETYNGMDFMNSITWDDYDIDVSDCKITDRDIDVSDYENTSDYFQPEDKQIVVAEQQDQQSTVKIKRKGSKDLAAVFSEWLKSNKGLFSAEDLRKVKLKRSTIESSIQRFGGGEKGMKRLLKLILEWVQKHHNNHQGKRIRTPTEPSNLHIKPNPTPFPNFTAQNRTNHPNGTDFIVHPPPDHNPCFYISNWSIPHLTLPQPPQLSPYAGVSTTMADSTGVSSMVGNTSKSIIGFNDPYKPTGDYPWSTSQFSMPSPTKEARRTRMARQKRVLPNHAHNHFENYQHAMLSGSTRENCISKPALASEESENDPANQVYWP